VAAGGGDGVKNGAVARGAVGGLAEELDEGVQDAPLWLSMSLKMFIDRFKNA